MAKVMKYKVGDKVRVRSDLEKGKLYRMEDGSEGDCAVGKMLKFAGKEVTISKIIGGEYIVEECERDFFFYYWTDEMFESVNNHKIVITNDGKVTLARLYDGKNVVKTTTAKCSSADTFDFKTGAEIAFGRLFETETKDESPKHYNGKVVCIMYCGCGFTKGKVYEFKDGYVKDDNGITRPLITPPIDTLESGFGKNFIPFVE